ncbi:MAG TPA: GNAT family protein [Oleiagrimonas sp.]|nr:GNAT family protein [Oleiagrimonas sp.]
MQMLTPRLTLDALRPDDAAALFACRGDPAVARYQGWRPTHVDEAAAFIARQAEVRFGSADNWCQLAIRLRDDGPLIGDLGVHFPATTDEAVEFGISLLPARQGHGYAREAVGAVLDELFGRMGYRRVTASIDPRNRPSIVLVEALGFRREAHHVESLLMHGAWVDDLVFALLKREWMDHTSG